MIGLLVAFAGFVISVLSLGFTDSATIRLLVVLAGIAVTFFGILMINRAYQKKAIWRVDAQ